MQLANPVNPVNRSTRQLHLLTHQPAPVNLSTCTVYTNQSTRSTCQCTVYTVHCTHQPGQPVQCTLTHQPGQPVNLYSVHCTLHPSTRSTCQCTVNTVHCTHQPGQPVQCTLSHQPGQPVNLYSVHCIHSCLDYTRMEGGNENKQKTAYNRGPRIIEASCIIVSFGILSIIVGRSSFGGLPLYL